MKRQPPRPEVLHNVHTINRPEFAAREVCSGNRADRPRIWHLIWSLDPAHGGTTNCAVQWTRMLAGKGFQVELMAGAPADSVRQHQQIWDDLELAGVSVLISPASERLRFYRVPRLIDRLNGSLSPGDILHIHGVWESFLWQAAAIARSRRVPYVVSPHGMLDRWARRQSRWKKAAARRLGAGKMLAGAAFVHALTEQDRVETQEYVYPAETKLIPNGIDPAEFATLPDPGALMKRLTPFRPTDRNILFLARIHPKKGLDILIEAFHRAILWGARLSLLIAGPDEDREYAALCRRKIADGPGRDRIGWAGPLNSEDRARAFAASHIFALPSHQEGFSMAVLEAMAARLPVLLSPQCRFPEAAAEGAAFEVPNSTAALAAALVRLSQLTQPEMRVMGERARYLAERRYSIARTTNLWIQEYRRITAA